MTPSGRERLLVCEWHHLGDAVNALPFVAAARTRFEVHVACNPATTEIFSWLLPAGHVHALRAPWQRSLPAVPLALAGAARELRAGGYTTAVCAWADARVSLLQKLARIPRRIGFPMTPANYFAWEASLSPSRIGVGQWIERIGRLAGPGPLLTEQLSRADYRQPHHLSWRLIGGALGIEVAPALSSGRVESTSTGTVLFHVAARQPHKRWTAERWIELGRRIHRQFGHRVEVALAPGEPEPSGLGAAGIAGVRTPTLTDLRDRIRGARFVVCLDSLAAHVAAIYGIPVVALFGRMPSHWFAPVGNESWVVGGRPDDDASREPDRQRCLAPGYMLADVTVDRVWERVASLERTLSAGLPAPE